MLKPIPTAPPGVTQSPCAPPSRPAPSASCWRASTRARRWYSSSSSRVAFALLLVGGWWLFPFSYLFVTGLDQACFVQSFQSISKFSLKQYFGQFLIIHFTDFSHIIICALIIFCCVFDCILKAE